MRSTYSQRKCYVCGQSISAAGAAWASHQKKHVRDGLATATVVRMQGRDYVEYNPIGKPSKKKPSALHMFKERVESEWSERATGDGYWFALRPGWTLDDTTVIHENTRGQCMNRLAECIYNPDHEAWAKPTPKPTV